MSAEPVFPPGMDMSSPEATKQLWSVISDIRLTKYSYVSATMILFWDICLTFDLEVQRVWKTKSSLGKCLFIFNRYVPPILFIFDLIYQLHPNPPVTLCVIKHLSAQIQQLNGLNIAVTIRFSRQVFLGSSQLVHSNSCSF
ncbi:hypothetical protein BKA70DRAFT_540715 [Coprinopsis sp. MPI-PUGE-AT-0042]|nr:hypothetical protein BKA70DRAFT_540715 [Coprinopsis sp. MPI-PUGE-AT-0042]